MLRCTYEIIRITIIMHRSHRSNYKHTYFRLVLTSKPSTIAVPEVIESAPVTIPNVVVLPAPNSVELIYSVR